jgi:hypothetical protein
MNVHTALGEYSIAVRNFEASAATLLASLAALQSKAAALPVQAHDEATRAAIANLTAAAGLKLSTNYPAVVAAAKGVAA